MLIKFPLCIFVFPFVAFVVKNSNSIPSQIHTMRILQYWKALLFCLLFISARAEGASNGDPRRITFEEALQLTLQNNFQIKQLDHHLLQMEQEMKAAKGLRFSQGFIECRLYPDGRQDPFRSYAGAGCHHASLPDAWEFMASFSGVPQSRSGYQRSHAGAAG